MDPRIQIIRMVIAVLASAGLLWLSPWWALVPPVALMFPPFGAGCDDCDGSKPTTMQVDLSGFTDGTCANCNEYYNISFILTESGNCTAVVAPVSTDCRWFFELTNFCSIGLGGTDPVKYVCLRVYDTAGNYQIDVYLGSPASPFQMTWVDSSPGTTKPVCSGFSARSIPHNSGTLGATCTHDASAALVTAL